MEYEVQIIPKHQLLIEQIRGEITLEAMVEKTKKLFSSPDFAPSYCGVVDMRKSVTRMSKVELIGFARFINDSGHFGQAPWAIIGDDPMVIALSQIFKLHLTDPNSIGVFSTVAEAAKFLKKLELLEYLSD